MLNLTQSELYSMRSPVFLNGVNSAIKTKLSNGIGVIEPNHIEDTLMLLKKHAKTKSSSEVILDAINLYERNSGNICLFDLGSEVPSFFPFTPGICKYKILTQTTRQPDIFVNLYKMGEWSLDEKSYTGLYAPTDLQTALESGYIAYKMIAERKADSILTNGVVLDSLTRIYSKLFYDAFIRVPGNLPFQDFQKEVVRYLIAKFFLVYCVQKTNDQSTSALARQAIKANTSLQSLASYEENLGIDYSRLSSFLSSLGIALSNGRPTTISEFTYAWVKMYGDGLELAIEYIPYLLHFLFAPLHSSRLGGSSKLDKIYQQLVNDGLTKLYKQIMVEVKK